MSDEQEGIDPNDLPEGLISGPEAGDFFNISETQLLVDGMRVVGGYADSGPDKDHADKLIPTIFTKIEGRVNGGHGETMDITLIFTPEAAATLACHLFHTLGHYPESHLGFDPEEMMDEMFGVSPELSSTSHWTQFHNDMS